MDVNGIAALVQSVGLPAVIAGVLMYFLKYMFDKNREDMLKRDELHREEMSGITEALNNNTVAITKLCEKLERDEK